MSHEAHPEACPKIDTPFDIINNFDDWVDIHNELLKMGISDPQKLVDALLQIWGDPYYSTLKKVEK